MPLIAHLWHPKQGEIVCQHGPVECLYNNVILCAQQAQPDQARRQQQHAGAAGWRAAPRVTCSGGGPALQMCPRGPGAPLPVAAAASRPGAGSHLPSTHPSSPQADWFPFVACLAAPLTANLTYWDHASYVNVTSAAVLAAAPGCAQDHGFDLAALTECAEGAGGQQGALQAQAPEPPSVQSSTMALTLVILCLLSARLPAARRPRGRQAGGGSRGGHRRAAAGQAGRALGDGGGADAGPRRGDNCGHRPVCVRGGGARGAPPRLRPAAV